MLVGKSTVFRGKLFSLVVKCEQAFKATLTSLAIDDVSQPSADTIRKVDKLVCSLK